MISGVVRGNIFGVTQQKYEFHWKFDNHTVRKYPWLFTLITKYYWIQL